MTMRHTGRVTRSGWIAGGVLTALALVGTSAWGAAAAKETLCLDLQSKANVQLNAPSIHLDGEEGNNLAELSQGEQTLEGVKFRVVESLVQLGGKLLPNRPEKV